MERKKKEFSRETDIESQDIEIDLNSTSIQQDIKMFCFYFRQVKGGIIICFLATLLIFLLWYTGMNILTGSWINSDFLD